jgi:hypothetical protein
MCNSHMTTQRQIQLCFLSICTKVSNQMMLLLFTRKRRVSLVEYIGGVMVSVIASNAVDWDRPKQTTIQLGLYN